MKCPECRETLELFPYEAGIEVEKCSGCHGLLLTKAQLSGIESCHEHNYLDRYGDFTAGDVPRAYRMAEEKQHPLLNCPGCRAEMERREYAYCSGILIDQCPACSLIWLNRGELEALEAFAEKQRLSDAEVKAGLLSRLARIFSG